MTQQSDSLKKYDTLVGYAPRESQGGELVTFSGVVNKATAFAANEVLELVDIPVKTKILAIIWKSDANGTFTYGTKKDDDKYASAGSSASAGQVYPFADHEPDDSDADTIRVVAKAASGSAKKLEYCIIGSYVGN